VNDLIVPQFDPTVLGPAFFNDYTMYGLSKYFKGFEVLVKQRGISDVRPYLNAK